MCPVDGGAPPPGNSPRLRVQRLDQFNKDGLSHLAAGRALPLPETLMPDTVHIRRIETQPWLPFEEGVA